MSVRFRAAWPVLAMATAALTPKVHAAGFALIEQSASGMGNAFAGATSSAEDASTVFFNPAGMTYLAGSHYLAASHLIAPKAKFRDKGSQSMLGTPLTGPEQDGGQSAVVPNIFLLTDLNAGWKFGLGLNVPFGLGTEYDADWIGRYHAIESSVTSININPSFAVRASDRLSLGFGLNAQYIDVTLSSAVDFGTLCTIQEGTVLPSGTCSAAGLNPQSADGYAEITGSNWSYGWNVGLMYDLGPKTRLGLAYRSSINHDIDGEVDFTVPAAASFMTSSGLFTDQDAQASVDLPDTLSTGIHHQAGDRLNLMADVSWTQWSRFDELRIKYPDSSQPDSVTTENWDDTWRIAVGGDYRYTDALTLRLGLAYDQGPVPDAEHRTPRIPDGDRTWLSLGAGYAVTPSTSVDVGYAHLFVPSPAINNTTEGALKHTLTGRYTASVDIFSLQLRGTF